MTAAIFGALIGMASIQLFQGLVELKRPVLKNRIGQFMPGFRASRGQRNFDFMAFIGSSANHLKITYSESALDRKRRDQILLELPDYLDLLSVALAAGESLYSAIRIVQQRATGVLASEFSHLISAIEMGSSLESELADLARRCKVRHLEEFANKAILAQKRGTPLARVLSDQSAAIRAEGRNLMLAAAGKNETKMLIPLVFMILPTTVLFAVYPSLQLLNFNYL